MRPGEQQEALNHVAESGEAKGLRQDSAARTKVARQAATAAVQSLA